MLVRRHESTRHERWHYPEHARDTREDLPSPFTDLPLCTQASRRARCEIVTVVTGN